VCENHVIVNNYGIFEACRNVKLLECKKFLFTPVTMVVVLMFSVSYECVRDFSFCRELSIMEM
jgi:hypothetical protein